MPGHRHGLDVSGLRNTGEFARRITDWQAVSGRHGLPWQQSADPYRVWLSEIMLQQTQVAAVIGYYERFLARFPSVAALAAAAEESVMELWSGLGYYSRARNLHRAAQIVMTLHQGRFPSTAAGLASLPGIGPSTAAAIAAFSFGERAAILDGNVRRVLCRAFGIAGDSTRQPVRDELWDLATSLLPTERIQGYTQGLMDLGATVCKPRNPACLLCPVRDDCVARRTGMIESLPERPTKKAVPTRRTRMLLLRHLDAVYLELRPAKGIWGGLLSLPELGDASVSADGLAYALTLGAEAMPVREFSMRHSFTHFTLAATVQEVVLAEARTISSSEAGRWVTGVNLPQAALPAPIKKMLGALGVPSR